MFGSQDGDEKRLLQRLRRGDSAAFAEWIDRFGPTLHRLSRRYSANESDAEDLTQEIFIALCRALPAFRGDSKLSTWSYRIAVNLCLKHVGRRLSPATTPLEALELPAEGVTGNPEAQAAHGELSTRIDDALKTLPDGQREVVVLHEMHGLTYAECAEVLGIPVGTVKSRLFHAFGRLRERLGGYVRGDEDSPTARLLRRAEPLTAHGGRPTTALVGRWGGRS